MTGSSGLRQEVLQVLNELRSRIRRYVFLEGLALVLCTVGLAFWISLLFDYLFEMPQGLRRVLMVLAATATAAAFLWYVFLRVIRSLRHRSLALVLERRFPELNERLITAVELAENPDAGPPLTQAMLGETVREARGVLERLNLGDVFNRAPLWRAFAVAAGLGVSIAGFRWACGEVFDTWFRRNLLFADDYYRRETDLKILVLADPGERPVEFRNGVYKHPRGADLALAVESVPPSVVPREVQYQYRALEASAAGDGFMTKVGDRLFRQKLSGLKDTIELRIRGGDFRTRQPLLVEVVDPPQIDGIALQALYPTYTGTNELDTDGKTPLRSRVDVLGAQVSLPAGTDVVLEARVNKPLQSVRLQADQLELQLTREGAAFRPADSSAETPYRPLGLPVPPVSEDGLSFRLPLLLTGQAEARALDERGEPVLPLRLPSDALLRFWLLDTDDIQSSEPARLTISSIPDQPPQVDVRLKGIGTSITRQATVPLVGQIRDAEESTQVYGVLDDYGVVQAQFEYRIEGGAAAPTEEFRSRPFVEPAGGRKELPVAERFNVLDLDLAVGQKLVLKVTARDGDTLTGPHISSSPTYAFQIVSDDELIALVAVKELNIRRRFEQILEEVRNTRKDLLLNRTKMDEARPLRAKAQELRTRDEAERLAILETAALTSVDRGTSGIRKNHNETQSIEEEFRDVRDELANNAIPDVRPILERIDTGIVGPLHEVNTVDFDNCDDLLVKLREALEEQQDPLPPFEAAADELGAVIAKLEKVLAQMLKNEDYNKVLDMLRTVIRGQEELKKQTEVERKKRLIEGLK
ncbi:MAG: hypothetical protein ACK50P_00650 [Planctomycetaceae bacterium]